MRYYSPRDFDRFATTYKKSELFPKYQKPLSSSEREHLGIVRVDEDEIIFRPGVNPMRERLVMSLHDAAIAAREESYDGPGEVKRSLPAYLRRRLCARPKDGEDASSVDYGVMLSLLKHGLNAADASATFAAYPRGEWARTRHPYFHDYMQRSIRKAEAYIKAHPPLESVEIVGDSADAADWRKEFKSKYQLCRAEPRYVIQRLIPEQALTIITAPSFHGKSWIALHLGAAMSVGKGLWGFKGPDKAVPFRYHVPEMSESMVRQRMEMLQIANSDMFLVRAMESGTVWRLDDERMMASARGAVVCLDTTGYFNEADDTSNYQQALKFGKQVFNLLTAGGALAVIGLYHPPKYSAKETDWTLENMVLGSAGYGGILRSCLGIRNLNPDPNNEKLWLYVQGLKNPRLKPFQLRGVPLTMSVKPGESPYLNEIVRGKKHQKQKEEKEEQTMKVLEMLKEGNSVRSIAEQLKISHNTVRAIRDQSDVE